jgi:ABC-type antimicrobial peptide transport system permease subunit
VTLASASSVEALFQVARAQPRLNTMVLAVFATAAVSLATVGLFAIIAMMVRQRTRDVGIGMALGATATDVRGMAWREAAIACFIPARSSMRIDPTIALRSET